MKEWQEKIEEAYEEWLLEEYPDEVGDKDDHADKTAEGYRLEDFFKAVRECFGQE